MNTATTIMQNVAERGNAWDAMTKRIGSVIGVHHHMVGGYISVLAKRASATNTHGFAFAQDETDMMNAVIALHKEYGEVE